MHTGCKNNLLRLFAIPPGQLNCVDNFAGRFLEGYNKSRESEWTWLQNKLFFPQHPVMYILHLCTSIYSLFNSVTDLWWPNWEPDTVAASQLAANPSFPSPPPLFPSPPSPPPLFPLSIPPLSIPHLFFLRCSAAAVGNIKNFCGNKTLLPLLKWQFLCLNMFI